MPRFESTITLPVSPREAYAWHARPGAFERLRPPWQRLEVVSRTGGIENGSRVIFHLFRGPLRLTWEAEHREVTEGEQFVDVQRRGPFARWHHRHAFEPAATGSVLRDAVQYALPLGIVGQALAGRLVADDLRRVFAFRHTRTRDDLALHARFAGANRRAVAVAGLDGSVGHALGPLLTTGGHRVLALQEPLTAGDGPPRLAAVGEANTIPWEAIDAVVFLPSVSPARVGQWVSVLAARRVRPEVVICAQDLGPQSADLAATVQRLASRVVTARLGTVIDPAHHKRALKRAVAPTDPWPWVSADDAAGAILQILLDDTFDGQVDVVAPEPTSNRQLRRARSRVLGRGVPGTVETGQVGVIRPQTLLAAGFRFRHPCLKTALQVLLGESKRFAEGA